jgi:hypothetical protein
MEAFLVAVAHLLEEGGPWFLSAFKALGLISLVDWLKTDDHWKYALGAAAVIAVGIFANTKKTT